jgi:hypothetical protein
MVNFLIGLDKIATQAAARFNSINREISLDVVLFANFTLLDELEEPWKADASGEPETQASGINWGVSFKSWRHAKTMMCLAESNAWAAAGNQASINRSEAAEERTRPAVRTSSWLGDSLWLVDGILESGNPSIDIIWVDCCRGSGGLLSRHCVIFFKVCKEQKVLKCIR